MTRPAKRRTQRIPEAQRHTVAVKLRLLPRVAEALDALRGELNRSAYVAALIRRTLTEPTDVAPVDT